jgi:hypothetical protein
MQEPKAQPEQEDPPENQESEDWRKSQEEWQKMREDATKGKQAAEFMENLKGFLNPEDQEAEVTPEKFMENVTQKLAEQKEDFDRQLFERDNPEVLSEANADEWKRVNTSPKYATLSLEEKRRLVAKEDTSKLKEELSEQAMAAQGTVPRASKTADQTPSIDPTMVELLKNAGVQNPEGILKKQVIEKKVLAE